MNLYRAMVRLGAMLAAVALVKGCGDGPTELPPPQPEPARPTTVTVTPATAELTALGAALQLTAEVRDQEGRVMAGAAVTWRSDDASVAVVDASGLVTAIARGIATITASAGEASGSAVVAVSQPVASVEVSPSAVTIGPGRTVQLTGAAFDGNGKAVAGAEYSWESSRSAVATVDAAGLVTGVAGGVATITARAGAASGTAVVTVRQAIDSVSVMPAEATLALGDTVWLAAAAFDADGRTVEDAEFSWKSSDDAVAAVDGSGLVTGWSGGTATITASAGGVSGTAVVTVTTVAAPAWVVVTPAEATLSLGDTVRLAAEVRDANGVSITDAGVAWSSSAERVAVVDREGVVRAIAAGETVITAESEDVSGRARITVVEPSDRGALVSLYRSAGGANWSERRNWLTQAPLGEWHGVTVDQAGRVIRLELAENNLAGPIPPQIAQLTQLRRLELENNTLDGRIPPGIGRLTLLNYLDLARNSLTGEIPPEIGELTAMTTMNLGTNRLSGRIPPEIGKLTRLTWLNLGQNDLTGEIPPALAIPGLQTLIVAGNLLRGPVPDAFPRSGLPWLDMSMPRHRNLYLCLPGTAAFVEWAARSVSHDPRYCNESDTAALEALHEATGGAGWTNSLRWLADPAVGEWFGVESDSLGRVVALDLANNGLSGELPVQLGHLTALKELRIGNNALSGRLPASLTALSLRELRYSGTGLCVPAEASFRAWLSAIPAREGPEVECAPTSDRDILAILYGATGGASWRNRNNWMTDAPLGEWHGVEVDAEGRVTALRLTDNNLNGIIPHELGQLARLEELELFGNPLKGPIPPALGNLSRLRRLYLFFTQLSGTIPPELGNLEALEELWLERIPLTGAIPPELGRLSNLRFLAAPYSNLGGPIPPELGRLANLEKLYLGDNRLEGPIPPALGNLTRLNTLTLHENELSGSIPAELGNLDRLEYVWLSGNELTGPVPMELGGLASARVLALSNNDLSGGLPATFARLSSLELLMVSNNPRMSGALPRSLAALKELESFHAGATGLCAPGDPGFQAWLATVRDRRVSRCAAGERSRAYLIQAAQSLDYPVPLVADEPALLRVFVTAATATDARIPPVRARFYQSGAEVHVAEIPGGSSPIPVEIEEGRLSSSANARIPASVIQPGLEMVIEIDPQNTLNPGLGVQKRIPATGRAMVEVVRMPAFPLTWIPMISSAEPDSSIITTARGLTAGSALFEETRTLLPIGEFSLTVHDPVLTSTRDAGELLRQVEAIRVMEGGRGYYMGSMANLTGSAGVAHTPGRSSVAGPYGNTIAHELGHNLSLQHAPCGGAGGPDPFFPTANASIGVWGYDLGRNDLVPATHKDLMSYCVPQWISDYSFAKALFFRMDQAGAESAALRTGAAEPQVQSRAGLGGHRPLAPVRGGPERSLLLWGGLDESGTPLLEPSFVVNAPPALPSVGGAYELRGLTTAGEELFALSFDMREASDGGAPSFVFALPAPAEWAGRLATITLSGPGGSVSLDGRQGAAMTILRDARTGRVTGMLRDQGAEAATRAPVSEAEVLFSAGVPAGDDWRR